VHLKRNRPGSSGSTPICRSVVTIGNFDGVHRGHQALIQRARENVLSGAQLAVVTFEPLPQAFFRPEQAPARLSTVYQKLAMLKSLGVDLCWLMRFDQALAQLEPVDFVRQVLVKELAVRHVVVGQDFRFGHKRAGNLDLLSAFGRAADFTVETLEPVLDGDRRISSTAIRQALFEGNFAQAGNMLGRPFRMDGHVVKGQQLGRTLGYPTANLRIRAEPSPLQGIFAVYARICDDLTDASRPGPWRPGVASLGRRPTVGGAELLLEVHLFDFSADLYGRRLQVEFVAKLRDELHFADMETLLLHMQRDEQQARRILANQKDAPSDESLS